MKALVYEKFGPPEVMALRETEKPVPDDHEVLVKVRASSVNAIDIVFRSGALKILGLVRPMLTGVRGPRLNIVGFDIAGIVETVGREVRQLKPGDPIYGSIVGKNGGLAEYACIAEKNAALKPTNMTFEEAAATPIAAMTALCSLRNGDIQAGQDVLVNGASGGIGSFAVQLARALGAHVTGVCSTAHVDLVGSLEVDAVIDYTREDFTQSDRSYDLIYDAAGKSTFGKCKRVLKPAGIYVTTDFMSPKYTLLQILWTSLVGGKKVKTVWPSSATEDLDYLRELIEAGKVKAIIDRCYPLAQAVEAHRYYEQGHTKGKVVIAVQS